MLALALNLGPKLKPKLVELLDLILVERTADKSSVTGNLGKTRPRITGVTASKIDLVIVNMYVICLFNKQNNIDLLKSFSFKLALGSFMYW